MSYEETDRGREDSDMKPEAGAATSQGLQMIANNY